MNMIDKRKNIMIRLLLAVSGAALVLYTVPAWIPGMCAAIVICILIAAAIFKLPEPMKWIRQLRRHPYIQAFAVVWLIGYGFNFYNMWVDSSYIARLAVWIGMDVGVFTFLVMCCIAAAAFVAAACLSVYLAEGIGSAYEDIKNTRGPDGKYAISAPKAFALLSIIYVVGIFAIIQSDFLYQDDAARAFYGYKQWDYFARFLSTAMASIVHGGDYLVDIAPVPQIIAMVIMAFSGVIALSVLFQRTRFTLWEILAMIPLGLNPYFLECISFRFDAPYMAVSVLGGIAPLILYRQKNLQYILASALGVLVVCTSYQPATGIYPILVILIALRMWCQGDTFRSAMIFCLKSVLGYGVGLLYFKLVLMRPADAGYVSNAFPPLAELLPNTIQNLRQYYLYIAMDFKPVWLLLCGLISVFFVYRIAVTSRRKKWQAVAMTVLAFAAALALCFGIYPVLTNTLFAPRAMYGFGVLLAFLCVLAVEGKSPACSTVTVVMLAWLFFVFSFTYGNALGYQKEYTDYRINLVLTDLSHLEVLQGEDPVKVNVSGSIGQAPLIRNIPQNNTILTRLIPPTFSGDGDLSQYQFFCYYDLRNVIWNQTEPAPEDLPVILDTMYHTIYSDGAYMHIHLK